MHHLPPRFRHLAPAVFVMALLMVAPAAGTAQRFSGPGPRAAQAGGPSGAVQTPPPARGSGQTPPSAQGSQRPQPGPEQFLQRSEWWKDEAYKKELNLTARQVARITGIFDGRVREVTPIFDEYQKQLTELDRMTKERSVDIATYTLQVNRAEFYRSKLNETRTVMLYRIYRELSPDQYQKLLEIQDRRWRGRGRGGSFPRTW